MFGFQCNIVTCAIFTPSPYNYKYLIIKNCSSLLSTDDEDDDVDETDGKQVENDYDFPPQIKCNIEGLESER